MNQILKLGQTVHTESSGIPCKTETFLGGGGQGEVYRANLGGKPVALKWYFPASATPQQRKALEVLIKKGPPNERFLWPMELTSASGVQGFGYVMPLREPRYRGIVDLMKRRIEPDFRALAIAGMHISHSFLQLHSKGLCYRDISFGNVFFDPNTGDVLICDNDNVAIDGQARADVLGTPRFMAPEVVRGDALPSTETDLFSLAVFLFYALMVHHPLEGRKESSIKCFDLPAMTKLYGTEPVFIFDPANDSNRPVRGYHDNALDFWPIYPQFIRELFIRSFTTGIRDPKNGRVRESEWRAAMAQLHDCIGYCQACGVENFFAATDAKSNVSADRCWSCKKELQSPARIVIGRHVVFLNSGTKLFSHHVDNAKLYDFSQPVAAVAQHPTDPSIWGLKNLSTDKWVSTNAEGAVRDVPPGRSVSFAFGTKINFGKTEGEICR